MNYRELQKLVKYPSGVYIPQKSDDAISGKKLSCNKTVTDKLDIGSWQKIWFKLVQITVFQYKVGKIGWVLQSKGG